MSRTPGTPKTGGRAKGSPNKRTKLAAEILQSHNNGKGYCPMTMQILMVEEAYATYQNLPPKEGAVYLKMAIYGNKMIMDKIYGNIEIQKTEHSLSAEDVAALIPQIQFIEGYKPIDDPANNLGGQKEDDI